MPGYLGQLLSLSPARGTQGTIVIATLPAGLGLSFRAASRVEAMFVPLSLPPQLSAMTTSFGYPATVTVTGDLTAQVTVPMMGTDPLAIMTPGSYQVRLITPRDYVDSRDSFVATAPASVGAAGGSTGGISLPTGFGSGGAGGAFGGFGGFSPPAPSSFPPPIPPTPMPPVSPAIVPSVGPPPILIGRSFASPAVAFRSRAPAGSSRTASRAAAGSRAPDPGTASIASAGDAETPSETREIDAIAEWLVEDLAPHRTHAGPELVDLKNPELAGQPIPLERKPPPMTRELRYFDAIVSVRLTELDGTTPRMDERVEFRLLADHLPANDTRILEVSEKLGPLKAALRARASGRGNRDGRTDDDGKIYCWIRLEVVDGQSLSHTRQWLQGIGIRLGVVEEQPEEMSGVGPVAPPAFGSVVMRRGGGAKDADDWNLLSGLENMLREPGEWALRTVVRITRGVREAEAGIPRTEKIIGFFLRRYADHMIVTFGPPGSAVAWAAASDEVREKMRAMVIGLYLGLPRGLYAMGRDQIEDVRTLFHMAGAVFDWIAEDPVFALEVLAYIQGNAVTREIIYRLAPSFRQKIDEAHQRFVKFYQEIRPILQLLWDHISDDPGAFVLQLGQHFYQGFKELVGGIANEYLDYRTDSPNYNYFVGGFIAGDVLGYVLATIGLEALKAYVTAGIGSAVTGIAKGASIGARIISRLIEAFQALRSFAGTLTGAAADTAKRGFMRVALTIIHLLETLDDHLVEPLMDALTGPNRNRIFRMLLKYTDESADRRKITALAETCVAELRAADDGPWMRAAVEELAKLADEGIDVVPGC